MRKFIFLFFLIVIVPSAACYRYVPVERAAIPAGAEVRAVLTGDGIEAMRGYFGPDVTTVQGPVVTLGQDALGLVTEVTVRREGFPATIMKDTIQLESHHLARVEIRELDGKKTAGFSVGVVAAMAGAVLAAREFGGSSEESGEGGIPDPDAALLFRLPIFRIPFSIGGR